MATDIAIRNVGPIESLTIPIPEGGGVVVVKGPNGSGKTQTINAAAALATGEGKLTPRDGKASGEVTAFGCRLLVGLRSKRTGDQPFVSLGDKLDVATLVDPGLASLEANDARRIKALVGLVGAKAEPAMFYELVGGQEAFEKVVKHGSLKPDDPLETARLVKKDIEEAARLEKSQADTADGHAKGKEEAADQLIGTREGAGVPVYPSDAELQAAYGDVLAARAKLKERADNARALAADRAAAAAKLREVEASPTYVSLAESTKYHEGKLAAWKDADHAYQAAQKAADEAKALAETRRQELALADQRLDAARQLDEQMAGWRETLERMVIAVPTDEELAAAEQAVTNARDTLAKAATVASAKGMIRDAAEARAKALDHQARSDNLRAAARSVDSVLSRLIEGSGACLRVIGTEKGPRLVTETSRGDETMFAELSDGERVRIALEIAIGTLERLTKADNVSGIPLLPLPQSFWEGLDPEHRAEVAAIAKEHGVVILTGECSDGDLRVEVA